MPDSVVTLNHDVKTPQVKKIRVLQRRLLLFSLFNFVLVALTGLVLRGTGIFIHLPFSYKNFLHGHSHFAFGGWLTPALLWMIMQTFPELTQRVAYRHWRNCCLVLIIAAYGMLLTFPFEGYGPVSIFFSTLSIAGTYYFSILLLRQLSKTKKDTAGLFLSAALYLLMLSALGPFALGPIVATGQAETPLYFNCIYFYLHFQYNGWFTFAVLAALSKRLAVSRTTFILLISGCLLSVFLSFLWSDDRLLFVLAGAAGAMLQLAGTFLLGRSLLYNSGATITRLEWMALLAFALKIVLQVCNSFPAVAFFAYTHRPVVIAYIHLIMLGFVTIYILSVVAKRSLFGVSRRLQYPIIIFYAAFVLSELLLVWQGVARGYGFFSTQIPVLIAIISLLFPVSAFWIYYTKLKDKHL
jgi:hypothetical protein